MKVKVELKIIAIPIILAIGGICSIISYVLSNELQTLIMATINFIASLFLFFFFILFKDGYGYNYYISLDNNFYLKGNNIFNDLKIIKEKKIKKFKKYLSTRLITDTYKHCLIAKLNLEVDIYELKDGYQLLVFKNKELVKNKVFFDYNDNILNNNLLIDKIGIKEFEEKDYIEKYVSIDGKTIILLTYGLINKKYISKQYDYCIGYISDIKNIFENGFPDWRISYDGLNMQYDTIEEAKDYINNQMEFINRTYIPYKENIYFTLPSKKMGTAYHEFQTGNRKGIFFDQTSLLLSEERMEATQLDAFFERIIPSYDYYGTTVVNKEMWERILIESVKETDDIQNIIFELKPWAENSLSLYGCFTIIGI